MVIDDLKSNNLICYKPVIERIRNIFEVRNSNHRISSMRSMKTISGAIKIILKDDPVKETSTKTFSLHQLILLALNYDSSYS